MRFRRLFSSFLRAQKGTRRRNSGQKEKAFKKYFSEHKSIPHFSFKRKRG